PYLRLDEGGPGGGGPPEDRGGDGRGHDEGREPDRTSARRHQGPGLREGEKRAEPEPRGIGEGAPALPGRPGGRLLAARPRDPRDGRGPGARRGPVQEGGGRDPERRLSGGGPAREARIPTYPTGPVPTRHRRDWHV